MISGFSMLRFSRSCFRGSAFSVSSSLCSWAAFGSFGSFVSFRASFFDGLNYGEPVILEGDALHRIRLFKPFDLLLDLSYSTSVISPVDFSAFDLAPGCTVRLANGIRFDMLVTMGVAGKHKQGEFLWKFALTKEM